MENPLTTEDQETAPEDAFAEAPAVQRDEQSPAAPLRTWPSWLAMLFIIPASLLVSGITLFAVALIMEGPDIFSEGALPDWISEISSTRSGLFILIAPTQAFFLLTVFGLATLSSEPLSKRLGLVRPSGSFITWTLLALSAPVIQLASLFFAGLFFDVNAPSEHLQMISGLITGQSGLIGLSLVFLLAAIAPALSEELFFRGILRVGLSRRHRFMGAIFLPALIFAAVHMDPMHATAVLPLGLWFGCLAWWSGSTLPAIGAHLVNNVFAISLALQASAIDLHPNAKLLEAGELAGQPSANLEDLSIFAISGYGLGFLCLLVGLNSLKRDRLSANTD
jgi:membrane protease YdiL (CAAX protease family)